LEYLNNQGFPLFFFSPLEAQKGLHITNNQLNHEISYLNPHILYHCCILICNTIIRHSPSTSNGNEPIFYA